MIVALLVVVYALLVLNLFALRHCLRSIEHLSSAVSTHSELIRRLAHDTYFTGPKDEHGMPL